MDDQKIAISLKRFLLIENCPSAWKDMDLYLFRDNAVVFYVGQSELAFARVWEHLKGGFKGHSLVGRFIWANWPSSMSFNIELFSSKSEQFRAVDNEISAAERQLIQSWSPCFNVSLNNQPVPVPQKYFPANARLRCSRSLNRLTHEAERAVMAEDRRLWVHELEK